MSMYGIVMNEWLLYWSFYLFLFGNSLSQSPCLYSRSMFDESMSP
jgi:hypothetical protein